MTTMKLGELLAEEQIEAVLDIIAKTPKHTRIIALKQYLNQFEEQLEANGILPDYLAYVVEYLITQPKEKNEG